MSISKIATSLQEARPLVDPDSTISDIVAEIAFRVCGDSCCPDELEEELAVLCRAHMHTHTHI